MASTSGKPTQSESATSQVHNGVDQTTRGDPCLQQWFEQDREQMYGLIGQMVGQMMVGCGNPRCQKPYCHTGRTNTASSPVRHYTVRSAKAIAVMLLGEPGWSLQICPDYRPSDHPALLTELSRLSDSRDLSDPKSLMQQLSHTKALSRLMSSGEQKTCLHDEDGWPTDSPDAEFYFDDTAKSLDRLFETPLTTSGKPNPAFVPDDLAADWLCKALTAYNELDRIHQLAEADWIAASQKVVFDPDDLGDIPEARIHRWQRLVEIFDIKSYLGLCARICEALAYRLQLEAVVARRAKFTPGVHGISSALRKSLSSVVRTQYSPDKWAACSYPIWIKKTFLCHWKGGVTVKKNSIAYGALMLLRFVQNVYEDAEDGSAGHDLTLPYIAWQLGWEKVAGSWLDSLETWLDREGTSDNSTVHLASLPWLHRSRTIVKWFRGTCAVRMNRATALARTNEELTAQYMAAGPAVLDVAISRVEQLNHERGHYLTISVSRENVVLDAFDQIWQRHTSELSRPLKVRFGEENGMEVGQDLGGVQIEFLNVLFSQLFTPDSGEFEQLEGTAGLYYFRPGSLTSLMRFETIGLYMAIALFNGVAIPVSFPLAFYRHLLRVPCDKVAHISDGWPEIARFLGHLLKEKGGLDIEYAFPMQANGLRLSTNKMGFEHLREQIAEDSNSRKSEPLTLKVNELSLMDNTTPQQDPDAASDPTKPNPWAHLLDPPREWPGWQIAPQENPNNSPMITDALRKPYVQDHVAWLTAYRVFPQLNALRRGFMHVFSEYHLGMLSPEALQLALEGRSTISVPALKAASTLQGFDMPQDEVYIESFWTLVETWPEEKVKALVTFVTAAERVPATDGFGFKIEKMEGGVEGSLPHSSTCFQTLFLPVYADVKGENGLEGKLSKAVEMGLGFGMA